MAAAERSLLSLLLWTLLAACNGDAGGEAAVQAPHDPPVNSGVSVLAVHATEDLATQLRKGAFLRWGLSRFTRLRIEVGPQASGDADVWLDRLPASSATAARVVDLPVGIEGHAILLGRTRYEAAGQSLAVRLPGSEKPAWVVVARNDGDLIDLADEVLFRVAASLTGEQWGRRRASLEVDYLLRETPWMERSGRWFRSANGGYVVDPAVERDDLAEWNRTFAALVPIRAGRVTLLVSSDERHRPELTRLAADLDRAVSEMAPRVPAAISAPITVIIEPDHVAQGRHAGEIGEAVPGRRADLHLVYDPRDPSAYRYALAAVLVSRAGLRGRAPAAVERGAALWLSRDWYGRPYAEWLPLLAAGGVLPKTEEVLAEEEPPDASPVLWTPAVAAVIERLPGKTLTEKLASAPRLERVGEILSSLNSTGSAGASPALTTSQKRAGGTPALPVLRGVSLAMLNSLEGGYHAPAVGRQLEILAGLGANAVSLMPFASQPKPDRPELRYLRRSPWSETDIGLIHATRLARARGFHVLYKPHLWVSGGSWSGDVQMKSEADWEVWWRSYRRYILHHALLARWAGADLFSVGVELSGTVDREAEWRGLIAAVRLFFPRGVTYSGNWNGDLDNVRFWDRLDLIGVDAYFPLAGSPQAGREDLRRGAEAIAGRLAAASRRWGRPVLLTEVGFAARRGAWVAPHVEGGEYSEEDQALGYQALFRALGRPRWLAGTFVWKAFSAPGSDGEREADFRFQGRKAERTVKEYYGGGPHLPGEAPGSPRSLP